MILRILAVGDVVGAPGLTFLTERLRAFQEQEHIDFTVVNGENANVVGVTPKQADAIFAAGADVITLGNHTWTRYELQPYLEQKKRILRPANFAPQCPGRGWGEYSVRGGPICVINLMGRFTLDAELTLHAAGRLHEIKNQPPEPFETSSGPMAKAIRKGLADGSISPEVDVREIYYNSYDAILGIMQRLSIGGSPSASALDYDSRMRHLSQMFVRALSGK